MAPVAGRVTERLGSHQIPLRGALAVIIKISASGPSIRVSCASNSRVPPRLPLPSSRAPAKRDAPFVVYWSAAIGGAIGHSQTYHLLNDVEVAESQNGTQWQTNDLGGGANYGVSGAIQPNNLLSMTWEDLAGNMAYVTEYNFVPVRP